MIEWLLGGDGGEGRREGEICEANRQNLTLSRGMKHMVMKVI